MYFNRLNKFLYVIEQLQTELNKLKERKRKKQNKPGRSESELTLFRLGGAFRTPPSGKIVITPTPKEL